MRTLVVVFVAGTFSHHFIMEYGEAGEANETEFIGMGRAEVKAELNQQGWRLFNSELSGEHYFMFFSPTTKLSTKEILDSITEEEALALGYPSLEVLKLEYRLGSLAEKWRRVNQEDPERAKKLVEEYHQLFAAMVDKGWSPLSIDIEDKLPNHLMPKFPGTTWG